MLSLVLAVLLLASSLATAQNPAPVRPEPPPGGMPFVHDPSTIIHFHGRYYVYTTGRGIPMLSSPDEVRWTRLGSVFPQIPERVHAAVPKNNGLDVWAPDIVRVGRTFYLYYAVSSWGSFQSVVALATNTTLDPTDADYKWVDQGVVVSSDGVEEMNDIDPGVVVAPDGSMWLCFGSYHGSIKVIELSRNTGLPLAGSVPVAIARESEAADLIVHDGYFYLFVNHGSCCQGRNSEYNIRVGRSRSATGPYVDKHGVALTAGGGSLFLAAHDHRIGPGHFGRVLMESDTPDIEQFSLHYEADLTNLGRPTLGIRPLLWSADGWPIAGDKLAAGTYQIVSAASGDTLEQHPARLGDPATLQLGRYLAVSDQQWLIELADGGYYTITNAATKGALSAQTPPSNQLAVRSALNRADSELWSLDQLTDGSYRIRNKATKQSLRRTSKGGLELAPFAVTHTDTGIDIDASRWLITSP